MIERLNALFGALSPLWEMSLTAAYAAAVVAVLRLLLKKRAPRQVLCLLWLVVFARLLIPVSLESPLSIVPDAQQVQERIEPVLSLPYAVGDSPVSNNSPVQGNPAQGQTGSMTLEPVSQGGAASGQAPVLSAPQGSAPAASPTPAPARFPWQALVAGVWLAGAVLMGGWGLVSYLSLRRRLFDAIRARDGAWEHPSVASPFILGVIRPRIYLPVGLWGEPRKFILCHERAHLRRLDHIVKPVCWLALAIHWFNPAVWIAFLLMSRDIEAACDEAVIRQLGPRVKADYSATLLSLATNGRIPAPCPLAFDEGDAKGRIQNVLRYRRPALWIVVVSVVMALMAAVCLLTDPVAAVTPEPDPDPSPSAAASQPPEVPVSQAPEQGNSLLDPWMEEVLNGRRTFSGNPGEEFNIHQLRTMIYGDDEPPAMTVEAGKLAVMDLDRDGIDELVVWPTGEREDGPADVGHIIGYLIFRRQGDSVKAYWMGWRPMQNLKADGTFTWSGSASRWGTGSARFPDGVLTTDDITWQDATSGDGIVRYYVDGRQVSTWEEFNDAIDAQVAKPEPIWYVFEGGQLKYAPIRVPILMEESDLTAPVPDFLNGEQQLLYRQMHALYGHIFGANTEEVDSWPGQGGPNYDTESVEVNGAYYVPAVGRYTIWADFEEAVLSVCTPEFWALRNGSDGTPTYMDWGGTLYYQPAARGSYGCNPNFPETFRLVERTEDTISFIMTGYYSEPWPVEGESYEDRDARIAAGWEYSVEYSMRMVRTEKGWRFDEFYSAQTDNHVPGRGRRIENPDAPPRPSPEPTPTPERTVISESRGMQIVSVGGVYRLVWSENGQEFPVGPDTVSPDYGPWVEDFDEDGMPEAIFPTYGSFPFTIYDFVGNALVGAPHPDMDQIYADISRNAVAAYNPDTRGLTVTYFWNGAYVPSYVILPEGFFAGHEQLADGRPLYVTLQRGMINGVNLNPGELWYRAQLTLTDGTEAGPVVGNLNFFVQYDAGAFEVKDPGEVQWLPAIVP